MDPDPAIFVSGFQGSVVDPDPHGSASASGYTLTSNKNPYTDLHPHPHQNDKLDPDPHQFADDKQKGRYGIRVYFSTFS
jgi:hypothetical protein